MPTPPPSRAAALLGAALVAIAGPAAARAQAPAPDPSPSPSPTAVPAAAPAARQLDALPYVPGLDPAAMDRAADPCVDFYAFACGGWMARNPIPGDQGAWDVFRKMADENRQFLWGLLDEAARRPDARRAPAQRKLGDYFAACMDEDAVERLGAAPLRADLGAVAALRSPRGLAPLLGRLHPTLGDELGFAFGSAQDPMDATRVIAEVQAGGLGLPDRDYYVGGEARFKEAREKYEAYVARLLELTGDAPDAAREGAAAVLRLETRFAKVQLTQVEKRDPYRVVHRLGLGQLQALTPAFDWSAYLRAAGAPRPKLLNVTEPAFLLEVDARVTEEPLATWKLYLRARLADQRAPYLSRAFQRAHFEFHDAFLNGVKEERPRWKKCVAWADRDLGEALGQLFVARAFPPGVKAQVEDVTRRIQAAMAERIRRSAWMGAATKQAALEKLAAMRNKIGYPARWRDYRRLQVARGDLAGNVTRAARFESARQLAKIGRQVDRDEWAMTPPSVNAYYDPQLNDVNFPAGVLLPPLWDPRMDLAPGYGNTGGTIGHELTHGFDDEGRQFDARGNLRDWWTPQDAAAFEARAACVVEQFARYPVVDDLKINSRLTVGEDIADLGGVIVAWAAWKDATRGQRLEPRDGLTPEQRFFVGNAQWACANVSDATLRLRAVKDPHSPLRWRVNGLFANVPEFQQAFGCTTGQPMAPAKRCEVW